MKKNVFYVLPAILLFSTACWAEQDFYGIQMRNDRWAQNLVLGSGPAADARDLSEGPVLNHAVHAEASLKSAGDEHLDFRVNVINESSEEISSDYRYRDFYIYTTDGRKYSLIDENDDARLNTIQPGSSKIFNPSLGNLRLQSEEVRMISCSFDLGKTEIFLFPWSKKDQVNQLRSPEPSAEQTPAPPMIKRHPKDKPAQSGAPRKNFMQWLGFQSPRQDREPTVRPAPVTAVRPLTESVVVESQPAASSSREKLDQAIKNFVYKPATDTGSNGAPVAAQAKSVAPTAPGQTRNEAHVIGYDKANNFVTLNLGFKDGLRQNMTIGILRDGKTVAKAKVKQLRDSVSAAILMPGISQSEVRPGDKISLV